MTSRIIAADWIVPVVTPPIRDGVVVLEGARVVWLGHLDRMPTRWAAFPVEHRSGVVTPGLVNAHTHLQYTHFDEVGRGSYSSFEHWSAAFGVRYDAVLDPLDWHVAAVDGARQAISSGTTVFAEIVTNDEARGALTGCGVHGIEYLEAIGHFDRRWRNGARAEFIARLDQPSAITVGISPHAPYSLDGSVIIDLLKIAKKRNMRVHSHVAESAVEAALYGHGDGSVLSVYGDLRDEFDLVRKGGAGVSTAAYADSIGLLNPTTHLAHAIYLDPQERDLLLRRGTRVALCPRSNAVIGLDAPPVAAYLAEGHEIAVGTDSLASSPSLDLMSDVRLLAELARSQGYAEDDLFERLIRAATTGGAKAMGAAESSGFGALAPGGPADLALFAIEVPDDNVERALVYHGAGHCVLTIANGRTVYDAEGIDETEHIAQTRGTA
ncbi:MAG: cytosine deaminase [Microbacteriaceae bacterium]|nr:MAG: cytosine deaminase [Microbacteriaceae bacterium]